MLDDRDYMRGEDSYRPRWPVVNILLAVNVAIFVLVEVLQFYRIPADGDAVLGMFALSLEGLQHGRIWQLFTFQFLHAGLLHLLFNALTLYFFGRAVEEALGRAALLKLYFSSGVVGGLLQMVGAWLLPTHFGYGVSVVGASAGVFGLVAAFAAMFPDRTITLLLFFIIPVSLRARTLLWVSAGLAVFGMVVPRDTIAHAAHFGGMLAGLAFVRWFVHAERPPGRWRPFRRREMARVRSGGGISLRRVPPEEGGEPTTEEFISREVDPILDKISAHGIHSLTERERKILEAARNKMSRRRP
ncbi:MAG: rhomboid family intramembrane serine protease [Verrucomicrobia bacterium]|nr:rhomboid family intramembrane serine protease [Verrucomicrobiota bacterium]